MDGKETLKYVDHTLLTQTATWEEIRKICDEAMEFGTASVCIPPSYVKEAKEYMKDRMAVCTVIGFPLGYSVTAAKVCEVREALADGADVLMPNLTEASILTKRDYPGQDLDDAAVTELLDALLGLGAKNVVLKGIDHGDGKIINYVASAEKGAAEKVELVHDKLPYMIHGTGDAFASALCGAVMAGKGLSEAAAIAGEFVRHAMESTRNQPHFEERGVSFELDLGELTSLVK
mgnify:CR=1 FL=1